MAFKRPTPKTNLSTEEMSALVSLSSQQTGKASRVKTYDPNFPVFEVPVNQKLLVYIPNHIVTEPDGTISLRKDKFAAHQVIDGRSYSTIRCTAGLQSEALGLDGSCPLCDASAEVWDLYNREYAEIAAARNIAVDSPEAKEDLKQVRIDLLSKQVIKPAEVWYTFPIVVIECTEVDGKLTTTPKKNEQGQISGKPMWYSIREKTYIDKWVKGLETAPSEDDVPPTHPGGLWAVLNYTYESKDGKHDKMSSAKSLSVGFKAMSADYTQWATYFDQLTEEWTPMKAMEVLVDNALRDMNEQKEVADTLLKPVRDKIALYDLSKGGVAGIPAQSGADATLASFGATPVAGVGTPTAPTGAPSGVPQVPTADTNIGVQ